MQVLTDVFQYHVPPVRRIPQLLIVRLRHAIAHYIVNREADGVMVMYWYHRQFIEAAKHRYVKNTILCTKMAVSVEPSCLCRF